jgi:hypothetical protein
MKQFRIYTSAQRHLIATPIGFSTEAFSEGPVYFLAKGWILIYALIAGTAFLAALALFMLSESLGIPRYLLAILPIVAAQAFLGGRANAWQEAKLRSKGYKSVGRASAATAQDALRRWGASDAGRSFFASAD